MYEYHLHVLNDGNRQKLYVVQSGNPISKEILQLAGLLLDHGLFNEEEMKELLPLAQAHVAVTGPGDSQPADTQDETRKRVDAEICVTALLLTELENIEAVEAAVSGWTEEQRFQAWNWATLEHLYASDNEVDRVPCPEHVQQLLREMPPKNWQTTPDGPGG